MEQWCTWLAQFWAPGVLATLITLAVSWAVDGWTWWAQMPGKAKAGIFAALCILVSLGAWFAGSKLNCEQWPTLGSALYVAFLAALTFLAGAYQHENEKEKGSLLLPRSSR
jgi:hypothetical protein